MTREELVARRKALGLTRERLSFALGRSYKTIGQWERGATPIPHWVDGMLAGIEHTELKQLEFDDVIREGRRRAPNGTFKRTGDL